MPQVKTIERSKVMEALKDGPRLAVDYITALERSHDGWKSVNNKAVSRIRGLHSENASLRQSLAEMVNAFSFDKEFGPEQIHALNAAKRLLDSLEK